MPQDHGSAEAVQPQVLHRPQLRNRGAQLLENFPGAVLAAVVDDNNFVRNIATPQLHVKMLHRDGDATFFIARRNDDRQLRQRRRIRIGRARRSHAILDSSSQFGF